MVIRYYSTPSPRSLHLPCNPQAHPSPRRLRRYRCPPPPSLPPPHNRGSHCEWDGSRDYSACVGFLSSFVVFCSAPLVSSYPILPFERFFPYVRLLFQVSSAQALRYEACHSLTLSAIAISVSGSWFHLEELHSSFKREEMNLSCFYLMHCLSRYKFSTLIIYS
jgi:hypothetical protein